MGGVGGNFFLNDFVTLPHILEQCVHNVTLTTDTDKPTDNREQVEKVAAKLSAMFGGATATEARGYWCSQSAGLVGEGVTIVYSAATPEAVQAHAAEVVELCRQIKQDMQQEGVSLDVDGTLYII